MTSGPRRRMLLDLAAELDAGKEITTGSWILDFLEDIGASSSDHPDRLVTIRPDGSVYIHEGLTVPPCS